MADEQQNIAASELVTKSTDELNSMLAGKIEALHGAKFKHSMGQQRETHVFKQLKRDIARIKTVINSKGAAAK